MYVVRNNPERTLGILRKDKINHIYTNVHTLHSRPDRMCSVSTHVECYHGCYGRGCTYEAGA